MLEDRYRQISGHPLLLNSDEPLKVSTSLQEIKFPIKLLLAIINASTLQSLSYGTGSKTFTYSGCVVVVLYKYTNLQNKRMRRCWVEYEHIIHHFEARDLEIPNI